MTTNATNSASARMSGFRDAVNGFAYGGDYNPEQWPRDVWLEDAELMRRAGVNIVTLGVFAWSRIEVADGVYDFCWLDDVVDILHSNGIAVDMAIPDAVPPAWLIEQFPDILPERADGTIFGFGSRQHFDVSHPAFRAKALALTQRIGEHFAGHPAVAMWHVGNEYGPVAHGPWATRAFRSWLRRRYSSLDELNAAWSTDVWGQVYSDWSQVNAPELPRPWSNPSRRLDFHRFTSDSMLDHFRAERDILRALTPDLPIVTNFMRYFKNADYWAWAAEEDAVGLDIYPDPREADAHVAAALNFDLSRSLRPDQSWFVMEQSTGAVSQWRLNVSKLPGAMRLGSYQAIAHGSDGILFFQWRQARGGTERWHSSMIGHAGPKTRIFDEVVQLGAELARLEPLAGARSTAQIGMVFDWDAWWALELGNGPRADLSYPLEVERHYRVFFDANIPVDMVQPGADLSGYKLIVLAASFLLDDAAATNIAAYVRNGGSVVVSYLSGVVDENNTIRLGGYPGALTEVIGAWAEEFHPLEDHDSPELAFSDGSSGRASYWSEHLHTDAEVLARYASGRLDDLPAIVRHCYGAGESLYLSTRPDEATFGRLLLEVADRAGVERQGPVPFGVETRRRTRDGRSFLIALNHNSVPVDIVVTAAGRDMLTGHDVDGSQTLAGFGVLVLEENAR